MTKMLQFLYLPGATSEHRQGLLVRLELSTQHVLQALPEPLKRDLGMNWYLLANARDARDIRKKDVGIIIVAQLTHNTFEDMRDKMLGIHREHCEALGYRWSAAQEANCAVTTSLQVLPEIEVDRGELEVRFLDADFLQYRQSARKILTPLASDTELLFHYGGPGVGMQEQAMEVNIYSGSQARISAHAKKAKAVGVYAGGLAVVAS